jgi:hypothetical protein
MKIRVINIIINLYAHAQIVRRLSRGVALQLLILVRWISMKGDTVCTTIANHGLTPTMCSFEVDDSRSRGTDDFPRTSQRRTCTHKTRLRVAETVGLGTVIVIVWGLLLLPVIFYHLPDVRM